MQLGLHTEWPKKLLNILLVKYFMHDVMPAVKPCVFGGTHYVMYRIFNQ